MRLRVRLQTDPAWLDAQYNNRARIADSAAIFTRWQEASALARTELQGQLDVRYGDGPNETLDIFPAAAATAGGVAKSPLLVFIHGGYWRSLDKSDHSFIAPAFVQAGATVVVPNYALCPAVGVDDIVLQVMRSIEWTWRHADEFGGDASRIAVVGHSAGGHLAAMALSCQWPRLAEDLPRQIVAGAMGISGLYDLEPLRLCPYLNVDLKLTPPVVKRASPAFFPRPKAKFFAVAGMDESEEFLRHNRLIRDAWGPTTVPVCETLPGMHHLSILRSLADPGGRVHHLALRLLGLA